MTNKTVLAVVGMAGSGKSEAVKYLQKKLGCPKVYFGKYTFQRLESEGYETNYENEKMMREKIRSELGMGAYAKLALPEIKQLLQKNDTILIESMYSWDEYKVILEKYSQNFKTIAIYASPQTRFERLLKRTKERPMSNIEEFTKRDYSEIENTDKGGPIARADFTIINEFDLSHLENKLDSIINKTIPSLL